MSFTKPTLPKPGSFALLLILLICQQVAGQQVTVIQNRNQPPSQSAPSPPLSIDPGGQTQYFRVINAITLDITVVSSSCGGSNGSIVIVASGGTAPYTYTMISGWTQNNGNFPGRSPGTYNFIISDAAGLTAPATVVVPNTFPRPTLTMSSYTQATTCSSGDATVTLQATGGVAPYQYSMDMVNFQSSNVFANLSSGAWDFFVKDANGCVGRLNSFNISYLLGCGMPWGVTYTSFVCTGQLANIELRMVDPAFAPYEYSINGGPYQAVGIFNVPVGVHHIVAKDVNGKTYLLIIGVFLQCGVTANWVVTETACQQNNGQVTITPSGGAPPYTYSIDGINYQSSNVFTGLSKGNYYVTVRDANGYATALLANITETCPALTLSAVNATCGNNNGTITATTTNGTAPFQYSLDGVNFQTSNVFTNLGAGTYTVTLKDALNFTATATIPVTYNCLSVTAVPTNVVCGNMNGVITATGSGGTLPYQYSKDGINFQTSNVFTGLGATAYTVTIKDNTGATASTSVTITDSPGPTIAFTIVPTSCSFNDGSITITGTGGTPPYTYSIDNFNYQSGNVFTNLTPNPYMPAIRDANGCGVGMGISLVFNCPTITTVLTNETCGNGNGAVTVNVTNATAPFQYSIDGTNFQASNTFSGLTAGTYTITVRDAINYTNTTTINILTSCPAVTATWTNATCGNSNGTITATGASGQPPYQYSLDGVNFQASNVFIGVPAMTHTVTIKDAGGATATAAVTVGNIAGPQLAVSVEPPSCLNDDGRILLSGTGGTTPYQYSMDGVSYQSAAVFNNVGGGSHIAWMKDANGCVDSETATLTIVNNLAFTAGANNTICEGTTVALNNVSNASSLLWTPAGSLNNASVLNPIAAPTQTTKYYVTARLGSCMKTDSVTVLVHPAPIAIAGPGDAICSGKDAQLSGSGGVDYKWTPTTYLSDQTISSPVVRNPTATITYSLEVTDGNDCKSLVPSTVTITVTPPPKVFAGDDTSIILNQPFLLQPKDVNNSGFAQYSWSPSYGLSNPNIQSPIVTLDKEMEYTVTAITQEGCAGTDEIIIKVYRGPEIYVPSAFSPNGDGNNDILRAIPVGIKQFKYFSVFNRWGERVFHTTDSRNGWYGRIGSLPADTNVFVWVAEGVDEKGGVVRRRGMVTVVR
ncbi:MAG: gliding motility-associated C-terminal domain-containing protein [Chitinophagaceae bacterium]|nr:gliding motility-associated C-terminal domain-containing protein [Chitinophagaceae bacterium]